MSLFIPGTFPQCHVYWLRFTVLLCSWAFLWILNKLSHSAYYLFPVAFFFHGMYYTDTLSLFLVSYGYYLALNQRPILSGLVIVYFLILDLLFIINSSTNEYCMDSIYWIHGHFGTIKKEYFVNEKFSSFSDMLGPQNIQKNNGISHC